MLLGEVTDSRCELCDLPIDQCVHGLAEHRRKAAVSAIVRVSPTHTAHLDGCPHKGDDDDYTGWGETTQPSSWLHLCKTVPPEYTGEKVVADLTTTSGDVIGLTVTHVCWDCREHGPW